MRSTDDTTVEANLAKATEPRLVELYVFLQAYLHSLPQVLLQLHILMRHNSDIAKESSKLPSRLFYSGSLIYGDVFRSDAGDQHPSEPGQGGGHHHVLPAVQSSETHRVALSLAEGEETVAVPRVDWQSGR